MITEQATCACGCGAVVKPGKRFKTGHYARTVAKAEPHPCGCGCGKLTQGIHVYARGHGPFKPERNDPRRPLCACGCGEHVRFRRNRFVDGHQNRNTPHEVLTARIYMKHKGKPHTPEAKAKMSAAKKAWFAAGNEPWNKKLTKDVLPALGLRNSGWFQTAADHYDRSFPTTSSTLEAIVQIAIWESGIPFLFNVPIRHICRPDFMFPDARIVVNVDAEYWHRDRKDKDAEQDATLLAEGWLVFRWGEDEVKDGLPSLIDALKTAYSERLVSVNEQ